jgi:hypothetical protein
MITFDQKDANRAADRVASPAPTKDGDRLFFSLSTSTKAFNRLEELAETSNRSLADVLSKALVLYLEAADANRKGKAVGIAPTADVLETEFVGF